MSWLFLSFFAAIFEGIKYLYAKKLTKNFDEFLLGLSVSLAVVICLAPFVIFNGVPDLGDRFFISLIITGTINAITLVLILKALKTTDLSLVVPILSLSPVFLLLTSPVIVGEIPSLSGLIGVLVVLSGTYVLNFKNGINFQPFLQIIRNKGQRMIVVVTILWAISSNFYKIGMQNSSPLFFILALNIFISIFLLPINLKKKRFLIIKNNWKILLPLGVLSAGTAIFQWNAVNLNLIVYVLSIKRLSIVISILGAYIFFKEKNSIQRIIATVIILIGVLVITFLG